MPRTGNKNKRDIILVSAILLFSLALMTLNVKQEKGVRILDSIVGEVLSPFQNYFAQPLQSISDSINHYFLLIDVAKQNDMLKLQVQRLISEKNQLIERLATQKRLAKLMDYEGDWEGKTVMASVIGRDATQWSKVVVINKGSRHGLKKYLAVVTHSGVIGQIIFAGPNTSKVLLTIDSRSAIDSIFQDSRVSGVVVGTGKKQCQIKYVPNNAKIKVGDRVLSSGLGGIFPKGLFIGTVFQVVKKKQGLFQEITLVPGSDLSKLEEVLVLLS